ncbi:MAG: hypothetical protein ACJ8FO_02300 [Sphingomicrobium sp.]
MKSLILAAAAIGLTGTSGLAQNIPPSQTNPTNTVGSDQVPPTQGSTGTPGRPSDTTATGLHVRTHHRIAAHHRRHHRRHVRRHVRHHHATVHATRKY